MSRALRIMELTCDMFTLPRLKRQRLQSKISFEHWHLSSILTVKAGILPRDLKIMIFHLGCGTLEITIMRIRGGGIPVKYFR